MNKKAIVQIHIDMSLYKQVDKPSYVKKMNEQIYLYSKKSFDNYCKKYDLDHILINEPKIKYEHPVWERLDLWLSDHWFNTYDEICYVDTDVFAMPWARNIFEESNKKGFKRIKYNKTVNPIHSILYNHPRSNECYFQSGVILLNKEVVDKTIDIIKDYKNKKYTDDGVLVNYAIMESGMDMVNIDSAFNTKYLENINLSAVQFLHAFGRYKDEHPDKLISLLETLYV